MADFVHKYPYTDLENLNLDWILENEKRQNEAIDAVVENDRLQDAKIATIENDITTINGNIEDINGDIAGINSRLDEVDDNIGDLVEQDTHLEGLVATANGNAQNAVDKANQANNNASSAYNAVNTLQSKHNSDVARLEAQISALTGGVVPDFYKPNILFNCDDFVTYNIDTHEVDGLGEAPIGIGTIQTNNMRNSSLYFVRGEGFKVRNSYNYIGIPIIDSLITSFNADNPITVTLDTNEGIKSVTLNNLGRGITIGFSDCTIECKIVSITDSTWINGFENLDRTGVRFLELKSTTSTGSIVIKAIKAEYSPYFTGFSPMPFAEYLRRYYTIVDINKAINDITAITETAITGGDIRFGFYRRPAEATEETQPIYWICKGYYVRQFNEVNVHLDVCYANYTDPYAVVVDSPIYEIAGDLVLGDGLNKFILPAPKSELLPAYSLVSCYGVPVQTSLDTIVNDLVKSWVSINLSGECYLFTVIKEGALLYNQDSPDNTNPGAPTFTYDFNYICR